MTRLAPIFPVEGNEPTQIGISLEKRHQPAENPPIYLSLRKLKPQEPQHGKCVDDVSQGTWLEDKDLHATTGTQTINQRSLLRAFCEPEIKPF
jgi:hypothetical protein